MIDRTQLTGNNNRFTNVGLEAAAGDRGTLLRPRRSLIVVSIHGPSCSECAAFLNALASERSEFDAWDADLAVVVADGKPPGSPPPSAPLPLFFDPERQIQASTGAAAPAVSVVDQWGEIVDTHKAGERHEFPSVSALVTDVRYLATQCPECEGEAL